MNLSPKYTPLSCGSFVGFNCRVLIKSICRSQAIFLGKSIYRLFFMLLLVTVSITVVAENTDLSVNFKQQIDSGAVKIQQGDYPGALTHYFNALKISDELKSEEKRGVSHSSLGTAYYRLKDWDKALEHLNKAEELFKKSGNENKLADVFYKKGIVYDELPGQQPTAFSFLQKALLIYRKENDCPQLADIYNAIAGHYYMQRKTDSVAYYAKQALQKFEECGTSQQQAAMNINIAALLNSQLKHQEAIEYNLKGIEKAKAAHSYAQMRQGYKNLSETYAYMGEFDLAYENRVLYDQYKDSVFSADKSKLVEEMSAKYEYEEKEKQIAEKEKQIAQHRMRMLVLFIALLSALILIGMLYYIAYRRRMNNRRLRDLNATKDKLFSIISHDLKSPILAQQSALKLLIDNISDFNELQILDNLRNFQTATESQFNLLQNLLSWANIHTGRMSYRPAAFDLNDVIRESVNLYALPAQNKGIEIILDLQPVCVVFADRIMMQTVIRNLINNAVKYTGEGGNISVSCADKENTIIVSVKDNGIGMDAGTLTAALGETEKQIGLGTRGEIGSGLGLIICRELLAKNNSHLVIKSTPGEGSEVSFELEKAIQA